MAQRGEARALADGRVQRGRRNRERIIEALISLVQQGELQPTAEQVAQRAGVGARTVFRHFEDMDSLYTEIYGRVRREIVPLVLLEFGGGLEERVRQLTRRRAEIYERIAPFRRAGALFRWRSDFLREANRAMVRELRTHLKTALPELDEAPPAVLEAVDLLTSFETWERLRGDQRLGRERAQETVASSVLALLDERR